MSGAADLKEDFVLILELDFFVVEPAREIHGAIHREHLFRRWTSALATLAAVATIVFLLLLLLRGPNLRRCRLNCWLSFCLGRR